MSICKVIMRLLILTVFFCNVATANNFPHGCEVTGFGFSERYLILNQTGAQSFYLIQNHSADQIELQRYETRDVFMSPPLIAKVDPLNWGAFASDVEDMYFQCVVNKTEHSVAVNCRDVLEVCQYPRVKFALSNMGNYWVSINKSQAQVIDDATKEGIYLRW